MRDLTVIYNFSIGFSGVMLSLLGLMMCGFIRPIERDTRRYFTTMFLLLAAYSGMLMVSYHAELVGDAGAMRWGIFLSSLFSALMMPMLTLYMLNRCGERWQKSGLFWAVAAMLAAYLVLLMLTVSTKWIYTIDDAGNYSRGPYYMLLLVPPVAIMTLNLFGLLKRWEKLPGQRRALLIYLTAPLAGMVVQSFYYGILATAVGTIIGMVAMFVFILRYQVENYVGQAEDNARKEFGLKVLQMRPHFIYNAMTSIYYMVDTDPEAAKSAIRDFSHYLHQNFSAVVKTEQIPFTEELVHTRAYLAVEQARFGERLEVTFDTPHTVFLLPPLTLEPVVENAIKHGMDPDCDPLRIVIRTRAGDGGSEITVENDGVDFDATEPDGDSVGLSSVCDRLRLMCGGSLTIAPREGGGTRVTLWIPGPVADTP